jgi:hypothetical protein
MTYVNHIFNFSEIYRFIFSDETPVQTTLRFLSGASGLLHVINCLEITDVSDVLTFPVSGSKKNA